VTGTIFYSNVIAKKIETEEHQKLSQWVEANKFIATAPQNADLKLASQIQQENADIPIIQTNELDSIIDTRNLDSAEITSSKNYLEDKLAEFKSAHPPILLVLNTNPYVADKYYYGDSLLLKQVKYYPLIQLIIVALFIFITLYTITVRNKSTQNQVWAGMAKETAHQLGTPISSLEGWVEMLKENKESENISLEMEKDVKRLKLISDRFGKIGSAPKLHPANITAEVEKMVDYIRRRAPEKVSFEVKAPKDELVINLSEPLFDWVIENLLKNALDAMEGKGSIVINIFTRSKQVIVDVSDTGKGIRKQNIAKVFKPGFTTKKRGWGLGLSLSKRIVENFHNGQLFIKSSEPGRGTTFRISLPALSFND
jgi:signal transduction histidine kinase